MKEKTNMGPKRKKAAAPDAGSARGSLFPKRGAATKTVDYMIDLRYGSRDWGVPEALRELIANAIDTKSEWSIEWADGVTTVTDAGPGLPKSAFVMGATSKADDLEAIGTFGEGLKMCAVTALRAGRRFSIRTVGYGVEAEAARLEEYGSDVMRVVFTDDSIDRGTVVKMETTEEEKDAAVGMFVSLKEGYEELGEGVYLPGGWISILGLATEERPDMIFSYDFRDKARTNRDRNAVKNRGLREEMAKRLAGLKDPKAIGIWLDGLKERPDAEEYQIDFAPRAKKPWKAAVEKRWGANACYSSTPEGDVKAAYKGYPVIPCPTKKTKATLEALGLKSSAMKTRSVKSKDVEIKDEKERKIVYPIARDYVKDWGVREAGRELVANAFDMVSTRSGGRDATVEWRDGRCVVSDDGSGIERRHFVIGASAKTKDQIGVFGEGFKMASLVLARENRDMRIETVGWTYRPSLERSEEFGTEIFCFRYEPNGRKRGTEASFAATEEETEAIRGMFIRFREDLAVVASTPEVDVIDDGEGAAYVNGLRAATIGSLFSYDFKGAKELVDSRDREHVNEAALGAALKRYWDGAVEPETIGRFLTGWEETPFAKEYSIVVDPKNPLAWNAEAQACYPCACISSATSRKADYVAEVAGYKVVRNAPPYVASVLSATMRTADEVAAEYGDGGIQTGDEIVFPMTADYVGGWKEAEALRELIANALDEAGEKGTYVSWANGTATIEDVGKGIDRKGLLVGESGSRSVGASVGAFGEGLKLACLALTRGGATARIETVGYDVFARTRRVDALRSEALCMKVVPNDRKKGTKITCACLESSLEKAKSYFLVYDGEKKPTLDGVYEGGTPAAYVNGCKVTDISGIGFSYDFRGAAAKREVTRDRDSFRDPWFVTNAIFAALSEARDGELTTRILKSLRDDSIEGAAFSRCTWGMSASTKRRWRKAALEAFPNSCLPSRDEESRTVAAKDSGIVPLSGAPGCLLDFLRAIGFPTAEEALAERDAKATREAAVPANALTDDERAALDAAKRMVADRRGKSLGSKLKVVATLDEGAGKIASEWSKENDEVFVSRAALSTARIARLLGSVEASFAARAAKAKTRTLEYENAVTDALGGVLAEKYA